jgi:hypothetical protein
MKLRIICLLLPVFLLSCSKKPSEAEHQAAIQPSSGVPFQITMVEQTPEAKEQAEINDQAMTLFKKKEYDKLEELTAQYRASKECYADGTYKLALIYDAVAAGDELPSEEAWEARQAEIQEWIKARPESATARITLARFLRNYAWAARGSDWASKVKEKQWQLFGERLDQAVEVLNDAKERKPACPVFWSTTMGVGLGLQISKSQFNNIFNQAITAFPDYTYYYHSRAVFLLPRWNGDEGEWEKDLAQSADRIGGEKGDFVYAQVVWDIHHYGESIDVFEHNGISWDRVDRGFAAILKQFPDSLAAKNERAYLAGLAGDKEKARKYFIQTEGKVDLSIWDTKDEFMKAANWAFGP